MMTFRSKLIVFLFALILPFAAHAEGEMPSAEKLALAEEYIKYAGVEDDIKAAVAATAENVKPDQRVLFKSMADKYIDFKKVRNSAVMAAASTFTEDELKAMTAFSKSPEGQSARKKMPEYQKLVQPTITEVLQNFITKIQDASVLQ